PEGAPYGAITIDPDACTLCLACASLCPVGAIGDNPDRPEVNFRETACLQCGICASTCPENAITLEPRLDLTNAALSPRVLNSEEPFECIECGKPFGVRSTIERIVEKLEGKHWMYTNSDNTRLVQMCDDCRVKAQYHDDNSPFRMGQPRRTRTTDDYS
ncbi:MAG: 4Fe-4S binding protein, partial [Paracoccaceae bacterium]